MIYRKDSIHEGLEKLAFKRTAHAYRVNKDKPPEDLRQKAVSGVKRIRAGQKMKEVGSLGLIGSIPISFINNPIARKAGNVAATAGALSYLGGYGVGKSGERKLKHVRRKLRGM